MRWILGWAGGLLLHTVCVHAEIFFLNDVMPTDIQKQTGVDELSYKQRLILEKWLNDTFTLKTVHEEHAPRASQLYLSQNIDNGKRLELSDGSIWEVAPEDLEHVAFWIVPFPLYFVPNDDPTDREQYPCKLVNGNTNIGVRVRQVRPPSTLETPPS